MNLYYRLYSVTILILFNCSQLLSQSISASASDQHYMATKVTVSERSHTTSIGGQAMDYTSRSGYMHMANEDSVPKFKMFFTAYSLNGGSSTAERPITFVFNGGPGSASVWLHMGGLGPKRILMTDEGEATKPPYQIVDNPQSWLNKTDLVFIDPVETGYSRPAKDEDKKQFLGYEEDLTSVGDFIRAYVSHYDRWNSPKFLAGESYGTTRAAGLSGYLQDRYGMYLNGLVLISSIMNFGTVSFEKGTDLGHILYLPTYAAIAAYHKTLPEEVDDIGVFVEEVKAFAEGEYSTLLMKGDKISEAEKQQLADKLHTYTGLSKDYLTQTNYRIHISRFVKELLRERGQTVGRLDGRITGLDYDQAGKVMSLTLVIIRQFMVLMPWQLMTISKEIWG